ncbi:MAG: hypothetical protein AB7Q17_10540 [Phycisphaerae bacterium]
MDTETRHALKQNELADALMRVRMMSDKQMTTWIAVIVGLVVLIIGWRAWSGYAQAAREKAWAAVFAVPVGESDEKREAPAKLREMLGKIADPAYETAVRMRLSTSLLHIAQTDPAQRDAANAEAVELLKQVIATRDANDELAAAAHYMLATAHENAGRFDEAEASYKTLQAEERFATSPYAEMAAEKLELLADLRKPLAFTPGLPPPPPAPETQPAAALAPPTQPSLGTTPAGDAAPAPAIPPKEPSPADSEKPGDDASGNEPPAAKPDDAPATAPAEPAGAAKP